MPLQEILRLTQEQWYNRFLEDFKAFVTDPQIRDYSKWADEEDKPYQGFHVSAESGNLIDDVPAWDYYGSEYKALYPNWKTHYKMEKFLEEHDAWAEWNSPGDLAVFRKSAQ